jgi:UDP-N-acetyl-2-amino-2-deoxyglucuronate dehydrogenase
MHPPSRVSFSTLAFPDATLASAVSLGRRWGYAGVELRIIDWISVEWEKRWHPEIEAPEVALPQYRRVLAEWMISQHRFDPGLVELKRLLDDRALGRLVLAEASTKWYRTQAYYDSAAWRGTWTMDGGSLMNQGVHYVDLLRWCLGPAAEVTAMCATQAHQIEVEDTSLAIARFASGAVGTILSSTAARPGFPQRLEITGTEGTVTIEDGRIVRRALAADPDPEAPESSQSPAAVDVGADRSAAADPAALEAARHAAQLADLLDAVDTGREPAVSGADGRAALQVVLAVYESSRTGRPVTLSS